MDNAEVLSQAANKAKTIPECEFNDALQLMWSALPEKAINNAAKDFRKRLQACAVANVGHCEHNNM